MIRLGVQYVNPDGSLTTEGYFALNSGGQSAGSVDWTDVTGKPTTIAGYGISDAETTTQLNTRDTNNRNRANHTGTQLASTVSDFSEAVDDRVSVLAVAGTNMAITYDDGAGTLTFDATGGGLTYPQIVSAISLRV